MTQSIWSCTSTIGAHHAIIGRKLLNKFPSSTPSYTGMHYQLSGDASLTSIQNAVTLHCSDVLFVNASKRNKNIVPSVLISDAAKQYHILQYSAMDHTPNDAFVPERLIASSK